jgi:hypothetical protein
MDETVIMLSCVHGLALTFLLIGMKLSRQPFVAYVSHFDILKSKLPNDAFNQKWQYAPVSLTAIYITYCILTATIFIQYYRDMTQSWSISTIMFVMYRDSQYYETCNVLFHWYVQLWFTNIIHLHFQSCSVVHSS